MTPQEYVALAARTEKPLSSITRLLHAALGLSSENGELVGSIKAHAIYGKALDRDNVIEEVGDLLWYIAILCNVLDFSLEQAMQTNIDKLRVRYPDRYTDAHAIARADKAGE